MQDKKYTYKNKESAIMEVTLPGDLQKYVDQAESRYESSKKYVDSYFTYIWRWAIKAYSPSTSDRQAHIKTWQSNIAIGIIRAFIDIMVSTLSERPITYSVT